MSLLLESTGFAAGGSSLMLIVWIVIIFAFMYFFMIRPQRKEEKKKEAMKDSLAVGDTVLTTSGFYGTVIDIRKDQNTIIVEFGNNKNCRIPMQMDAVAASEKPGDAVKAAEEAKAAEAEAKKKLEEKEAKKAEKKAGKVKE